ncbi:hypothetical protein [Trichormus azollae]|uniref:hypothetical protein n=1 Tax=Trichormus azollae TaxID=1164 RepID=UPI00325F8843
MFEKLVNYQIGIFGFSLKKVTGTENIAWAAKISPLMDIDNNKSPSCCYFRDKLRHFISFAISVVNNIFVFIPRLFAS